MIGIKDDRTNSGQEIGNSSSKGVVQPNVGMLKRTVAVSSIYLVFQAVGMVFSIITFPIMTRMLSVSDYGYLALMNATVVTLVALAKCGSPTALIRFYPNYRGNEAKLFSSAISINVLGCMLVLGTYLLLYYNYSEKAQGYLSLYPIIVVVLVGARVITHLIDGFLRAEERVVFLSTISLCVKVIAFIIGISSVLVLSRGLNSYLSGVMVVEASATTLMLIWLWRRNLVSANAVSFQEMRDVLVYGLPLVLFEVSWLINDYSDRFLINMTLGPSSLGVYSANYNMTLYVQSMVTVPLWMSVFPIASKMWASGERLETEKFASDLLKYYICIAILIVSCVSVLGRELVVLLAGEKYLTSWSLLPVLIIGTMISGSHHIIGMGIFLQKRTHIVAFVTLCSAACNILMNLVLLPKYGILGAGYATLTSYTLMVVLVTLFGRKTMKTNVSLKAVILYLIASCMSVCASLLVTDEGIVNVLYRGTIMIGLYIAIVYAFDRRLRLVAKEVLHRFRSYCAVRSD